MGWLRVVLWLLGVAAPAAPAPVVGWAPGPILDQGQSPTCVAFALVTFLEAGPAATRGPDPDRLYAASQARDGDPKPHDGTSVEAALGVLQGQGWVSGWRETRAVAPGLAWLRTRGPLVVAGRCADMLAGIAGVRAACDKPGDGHTWVCYGAGPGPSLRCQTTWGAILGRFRWSVGALARTLADGGAVYLVSKRGPRLQVWPV